MDRSKLLKGAVPIDIHMDIENVYDDFQIKFDNWIHKYNGTIKGLPSKAYTISGVTDAFNQLYGMFSKIGLFSGEYGYHKLVVPKKITYDLNEADVIIVSHPFSADGLSSHDKLKIADSYNKPIFVDCAFLGVCHSIDFDLSQYDNIHSVAFSLSKSFGTGWYRVGQLYTEAKYPVTVYEEWNYPLLSSVKYHSDLIDMQDPNFIPTKYKQKQIDICDKYKLAPSNTVMFGLDYTDTYAEFKRGNVNRICISTLLREGDFK